MNFYIPKSRFEKSPALLNSICILFLLMTSILSAAELSRGVNEVLQIQPDARIAALGGIEGPTSYSGQHFRGSEHQLSQAEQMSLRISHLSWIAESQLDGISWVLPLEEQKLGLGIGLFRFGQSDIPLVGEDEEVVGGEFRTFSVSEYILQLAYGQSWSYLRWGGSLYLLHRDVGQKGFGVRGDVSGGFFYKNFRTTLRAEALTSSVATWESDYLEYEEPEMYFGLGYLIPIPYFYGKLDVLFESAGLFGEEARRRTGTLGDDRLFEDPLGALSVAKVALEYQGDIGIRLRAGLSVLREFEYLSFGAGYQFQDLAGIDYALERHPELGVFHRFSLFLGFNLAGYL